MPSARENSDFAGELIAYWPLDVAVDWIKSNIDPGEVFDEEQLVAWAEENGFVREVGDD